MEQVEMTSIVKEAIVLNGEELDKALHDCMTTLWKAYRSGTKEFNDCFEGLYRKYSDPAVVRFIEGMGMGLVGAVNRKNK